MVVKGENRDTAWYSITDTEWPPIRVRFHAWLDPENFDAQGRQRTRLSTTQWQVRASCASNLASQ